MMDATQAERTDFYQRAKAALPPLFQERLDGFEGRMLHFIETIGPYELFVCAQAAAIAAACQANNITVRRFHRMSAKKRRQLCPALPEDNSLMAFRMACDFAYLALTNPELLPKHHAALCPMYGCQACACWATTQPQPAQVANLN